MASLMCIGAGVAKMETYITEPAILVYQAMSLTVTFVTRSLSSADTRSLSIDMIPKASPSRVFAASNKSLYGMCGNRIVCILQHD